MKLYKTSWLWDDLDYQREHSRVLRDTASRLIKNGGMSNHTPAATTLKVLLSYLEDNLVPYTLTAIPGKGYVVEVKENWREIAVPNAVEP